MTSPGAYSKGLSALRRGDYRVAEEFFTLALAQEPDNARVMVDLVWARVRRRRHFRSLKLMERAKGLAPNDTYVHLRIARIHLWCASPHAALRSLELARKLEPNKPETLALISLGYLVQRRRVKCEEALEAALHFGPNDPVALDAKHQFEAIYMDSKTAERTAREMLRTSPEMEGVQLRAGRVSLSKGEVGQARWHFREALRQQPNSAEARAALLDAIRQRNSLYNWAYRLGLKLQMLDRVARTIILYLLIGGLAWVGQSTELPAWFRYPVIGLYCALGILLLLAVLPVPILNLALRFHPFGRHVLSSLESAETWFTGALLLAGLAELIVGFTRHAEGFYAAAGITGVYFLLHALPAAAMRVSFARGAVQGVLVLTWLMMQCFAISVSIR